MFIAPVRFDASASMRCPMMLLLFLAFHVSHNMSPLLIKIDFHWMIQMRRVIVGLDIEQRVIMVALRTWRTRSMCAILPIAEMMQSIAALSIPSFHTRRCVSFICHLVVSRIPAVMSLRALLPSIESNYYLRFSASLGRRFFFHSSSGALNFVQIGRNWFFYFFFVFPLFSDHLLRIRPHFSGQIYSHLVRIFQLTKYIYIFSVCLSLHSHFTSRSILFAPGRKCTHNL